MESGSSSSTGGATDNGAEGIFEGVLAGLLHEAHSPAAASYSPVTSSTSGDSSITRVRRRVEDLQLFQQFTFKPSGTVHNDVFDLLGGRSGTGSSPWGCRPTRHHASGSSRGAARRLSNAIDSSRSTPTPVDSGATSPTVSASPTTSEPSAAHPTPPLVTPAVEGRWLLPLQTVNSCVCYMGQEKLRHYEHLYNKRVFSIGEVLKCMSSQEYVAAAVLLTLLDPHKNNSKIVSLLNLGSVHPMVAVVQYVLEGYPQFGGIEDFAAVWDRQVRTTVGVPYPSHQTIVIPPPTVIRPPRSHVDHLVGGSSESSSDSFSRTPVAPTQQFFRDFPSSSGGSSLVMDALLRSGNTPVGSGGDPDEGREGVGVGLATSSSGNRVPSNIRAPIEVRQQLEFSSVLDSGNLSRVEKSLESDGYSPAQYLVWIGTDPGPCKRLWFNFRVTGRAVDPRMMAFASLHVTIMNLSQSFKLYNGHGMKPVFKRTIVCTADGGSSVTAPWLPITRSVFSSVSATDTAQLEMQLRDCFTVRSHEMVTGGSTDPQDYKVEVAIAFTVPYGYTALLRNIQLWHQLASRNCTKEAPISFEERLLCRSLQGRKVHCLVLTGGGVNHDAAITDIIRLKSNGGYSSDPDLSNLPGSSNSATSAASFASMHFSDFSRGKKAVLVSARVHPGEVTASHAVHGLVSFLLSTDPCAARLRRCFVFYIVPMMNPDGVASGFTRMDPMGVNLNRCYTSPDKEQHPSVHALSSLHQYLLQRYTPERYTAYFDFHAQASQKQCFVYGNHCGNYTQDWNLFMVCLISQHAPQLSLPISKFSMKDTVAKDGTSRVIFGREVLNAYTVECSYVTTAAMVSDGTNRPHQNNLHAMVSDPSAVDVLHDSAELGWACGMALLDYCRCHSVPTVANAVTHGKIEELWAWLKEARLKNAGALTTSSPLVQQQETASSSNFIPVGRNVASCSGSNSSCGSTPQLMKSSSAWPHPPPVPTQFVSRLSSASSLAYQAGGGSPQCDNNGSSSSSTQQRCGTTSSSIRKVPSMPQLKKKRSASAKRRASGTTLRR